MQRRHRPRLRNFNHNHQLSPLQPRRLTLDTQHPNTYTIWLPQRFLTLLCAPSHEQHHPSAAKLHGSPHDVYTRKHPPSQLHHSNTGQGCSNGHIIRCQQQRTSHDERCSSKQSPHQTPMYALLSARHRHNANPPGPQIQPQPTRPPRINILSLPRIPQPALHPRTPTPLPARRPTPQHRRRNLCVPRPRPHHRDQGHLNALGAHQARSLRHHQRIHDLWAAARQHNRRQRQRARPGKLRS